MKSLMLLLAFGLAASEKLDRTYLPPPGSKYAGGSPGDLQVPLEYPKVTYTTAAPIKPGSNDHRFISPEDIQLVSGIQRVPGPSYQEPKGLFPATTPRRPFSYNVPTTTTSYAFTQTTTFPSIGGFETTINPLAQRLALDGPANPPSGIVNQPFNQNQNYPQSQVSHGRPNIIQPGSLVTQFPGFIQPGENIPGSETTVSSGQTIDGQPNYAQIQNQNQHNIPSSTILPTSSYNQGYTQHLGVQPPRQLINQEYSATPTPFPKYPSNVPLYQNTSIFQQTNPDGHSQQLGQQSPQIQETRPLSPFPHLQPASQFVDKNGNVQPTVVPSTSIFQQSEKYQGPHFGIQDTVHSTQALHNGNVFSLPGVFTPGDQISQPGNKNNLPLSQRPHQSTDAQGGSVITQLQNQMPQYGFQREGIPSISLPETKGESDDNGQIPFNAKATYSSSPGLTSSQTPYQPYLGQQLPSSGTQQELVQQHGGQLLPENDQLGSYPTTAVTQGPFYGPEVVQQQGQGQLNEQQGFVTSQLQPDQQYGDKKSMYSTNIPRKILTERPHITGQQNVPQGSSSYFPYGPAQEENKTDKISGVTSPATNMLPGEFANGLQRTPFVQANRQPNFGSNSQPQFDQAETKIPEQYTTLNPVHNIPGFTEYSIPSYNQKSIPSSTPVPILYSTTQGNVTPSSTFSYSNSQGNVPSKVLPRPVRPQAEADRNAEILSYENILTPNEYSYSFDTSNGIHADENGTTIDGTRAKGSYSYIGDDGKFYKIEYTADKNGFLPRGDHIPTPPPVPEPIQRVIDQAERDREAGISHDGFYDDSKYGPKRYQKQKNRHPQTHKGEDRTTLNDTDFSNSDARSSNDDENKYNTQPGRKPITKNNDGSLGDFGNDESDNDIVKDSITSRPQSIKLPGKKSGVVANGDEANTKTYHKQSSNKFRTDTTKPIGTSVEASRRLPESVDKIKKHGNKYKPRPDDNDYDFLTEDDFEQISSLENNKNRRPLTFKYNDSERRKYLPNPPTYRKQGIKQTQDDTQLGTAPKYDKSMILEDQIIDDEGEIHQNPKTRPYIPAKAQKERNQYTTAKYEDDLYNVEEPANAENTQPQANKPSITRINNEDFQDEMKIAYKDGRLRPDLNHLKKPQSASRPSFTRYDVDDQDTISEPQGTKRPSSNIFDDGDDDMDESADHHVGQQKPSKNPPERPQVSRKPSMTGAFEDVNDKRYSNYGNQQGKPEQSLMKKFGAKYPVMDHTDIYNEEIETPEEYISVVRGRPKNPTSSYRPKYKDHHYKQIRQYGDQENVGHSEVSIFDMGEPTYRQGNRDDKTGYEYTRPQNPFQQIANKFPTRFSETNSATRKPFVKYDYINTKTTAQPFMTPNVSRNDGYDDGGDDVYDDSSEENLPFKQPGKQASMKVTTPRFEDNQPKNTNQGNLDNRNEKIAKYHVGKPSSEPEYYKVESNKNKFRPGTKQLNEFDKEKEGGSTFSTTSSPYNMNEMTGVYTDETSSTGPSTFGTIRPSGPGSYTGVTVPSTVVPSRILPAMPTSQTVYDYPDRTLLPVSPNIKPGIPELVFSQPSPIRPQKPDYYSTNLPGLTTIAQGNINRTGNLPEDYYHVTDPTFTPRGDINLNSRPITALPGLRLPGQPTLQDLASTTYRPNYSTNDITRPNQLNLDVFGKPVSESITSGQNVPHIQGILTRPTVPGGVFNAGESRFAKPAEFGPSSITTPGYLGPKLSTNKVIGEDFSGPKQPQRFDPNTGYYYKK